MKKYFFALGSSLFLFIFHMEAQSIIVADEHERKETILTILSEDLNEEIIQFLKEEQLVSTISWQDIMPFEELKLLLKQEQEVGKKKHSNIILRTQYSNPFLLDIMNQAYNPVYTNISAQTNLAIKGIPLRLNTNITAVDLQVKKEWSSFSIDFDLMTYLEGLKSNLLPNPIKLFDQLSTTPDLSLDAISNSPIDRNILKDLSASERNIMKSELKFQLYQYIVTHPQFVKLATQVDQVKQKKTQIKKNNIEQPTQEIREQYQQQWEIRKQYYGDSLQMVQQKVNGVAKLLNTYNDPTKLSNLLLKKKDVSFYQKILAASKKINIGQSSIEGDWYTAKSFPIQGIQYQYSTSRLYGTFAYGRQRYPNQYIPSWGLGVFRQPAGANILHLKNGCLLGKQHSIEYNFIRIKDNGNLKEGLIVAPQNNTVFTISGKSQITSTLQLKATLGFSRNVWGNTDLTNQTTIEPGNSVSEITISNSFFNNRWQLELGYYYVGVNYITRANPFLQNNQQGFLGKVEGQLGDKLNTSLEIKLGQTIDGNLFNGDQKRMQLVGAFNWRPSSRISIVGQVVPNTFKHYGTGAVAISNSNFLYNLQGNIAFTIDKTQSYSTLGVTNHRTQLSFADTSSVNHTNYLFLNQSILLSKSWQVSMLAMLGQTASAEEELSSSYFQLESGLQREKWNTSLGIQYLKEILDPTWFYGIKYSQELQLIENTSLLLDVSMQWPSTLSIDTDKRFWGSLMITTKF